MPSATATRHIWSMWPSRTQEVGLAVVGAERAALGPVTRARAAAARAGCGRSRPRGSAPRRPCGASRAPPRRSSPRDPSGCRRPGRRSAGGRARPGAWPSTCVAPRSVELAQLRRDRPRSRPGSSSSRRRRARAGAAARTRGRRPRAAARGDSNALAGTHEDAITQTSSGTSSQTSSSQWMPSVPSTLAISCGSRRRGRAVREHDARANSSTISLDDSMCTCASTKPGTR